MTEMSTITTLQMPTVPVLNAPAGRMHSVDSFSAGVGSTPNYAELAQYTELRLGEQSRTPLHASPLAIPSSFAEHFSQNGRFSIQAKAWTVNANDLAACEIRMVLIQGTSNTIINTWGFPLSPVDDPVFAAELIAMSGKPRLTFMDVQVPTMGPDQKSKIASQTLEVTREFPDLLIEETPPDWAIDATAGNYRFARQQEAEMIPRIQACYRSMFENYLEILTLSRRTQRSSLEQKSAIEQLHRYQLHHMEHSPGNVFLGKVFGEQWTQDFLTQFLFSAPRET